MEGQSPLYLVEAILRNFILSRGRGIIILIEGVVDMAHGVTLPIL